ncbi:MAG: (2Fe-2S)-binding protein [Bdellovibrionales bacterium]|nr:(2Fe-2S)-binding protein [Bdellovibrionales bacterium]
MPKCTIDGREVEFKAGENLIEVARKVGIEVPYFCYHPALTVVAQCRMCAVEVEKMPKLQTACSTPAAEGMVVRTNSERAKQNQKSIMEFLLINHPLDCPICDKAGECDLQDNSYKYGDAYMRTSEERRTYLDLDMGPVIKKNMNRCIHCTRCIRFGTEVAGIHEMVAVQRGNNTEITTIDGRPLETDYAGNYADICPTGSLTLKDFRFHKRAWMLKKTATVCEGCSKGCNMEIHQDNNVIHRTVPRANPEINKYWLCDEGRFNYHYVVDPKRVTAPKVGAERSTWHAAVAEAKARLHGKKVVVLAGTDLTLEEAKLLQDFVPKAFPGSALLHFGTPGIETTAKDAPADKILKRKSKTSNLNGFEKLGIKPLESMPAADAILVVRGGRAQLPKVEGLSNVIGLGVFTESESASFAAVLPGTSFAEKDGTIVNYEGREQRLRRAITPVGQSKALGEVLMLWLHSGAAKEAAV